VQTADLPITSGISGIRRLWSRIPLPSVAANGGLVKKSGMIVISVALSVSNDHKPV
jgi:hypothetical protein